MNTLKIEIPKGFKIDTFDEKTGVVKFAPLPKDIKERIKNFEDVLAYHNTTLSNFYAEYDGLEEDEIAYKKIKMIAEALNEGWTPNWDNSNELKYYPWFNMGSSSGSGFSFLVYDCDRSLSSVGSRLCYKSRDLAEYAGKQFTDIYKKFLTLQTS